MDWRVLRSEEVFHCRAFTVVQQRSHSRTLDRTDDFFVLEAREWANVVPITADGRVVCVRQYRHGVGALTLEVPAGLVDAKDASPAAAARRELREETGFRCASIEPVGIVQPNPALFRNRCHVFVALDATYEGAPEWDPNEEIEVVLLPGVELVQHIRSGEVANALTIAALHLAALSQWGTVLRPD